jgi:hypothetical protein
MRALSAMMLVPALLAACGNGPDKTAHWVAGAITAELVRREGGTPLQSCAAALAVGATKEFADHHFGGYVDAGDAWATGAGCVVTLRF